MDRLKGLIQGKFWGGLTRRIDRFGIRRVCVDSKDRHGESTVSRVYIPRNDDRGWEYWSRVVKNGFISFPNLEGDFKVSLVRLPLKISPEYVKSIQDSFGILSLGLETDRKTGRVMGGTPFVVPGGRFNEMYISMFVKPLGMVGILTLRLLGCSRMRMDIWASQWLTTFAIKFNTMGRS